MLDGHRRPVIAAILGVTDDIECLEACIRHNRSVGVDRFVIVDLGSSDGTAEVVARLSRRSYVAVLRAERTRHWKEVHEEARELARRVFAPDYFVIIDADEFWLPAPGNLKRVSAFGQADILQVDRYNVILDDDLAQGRWSMKQVPLLDRIVWRDRVAYQDGFPADVPLSRAAVGPKVLYRAVPAELAPGAHAVAGASLQSQVRPSDLIVLHFPFSTLERFARKVANFETYFRLHPPQSGAVVPWHTKLYCEASQRGELRQVWEQQRLSGEPLARALAEGTVCRARDLLEEITPPSGRWAPLRRSGVGDITTLGGGT